MQAAELDSALTLWETVLRNGDALTVTTQAWLGSPLGRFALDVDRGVAQEYANSEAKVARNFAPRWELRARVLTITRTPM